MPNTHTIVMRRVHRMHALRPIVSNAMIAALLSLGSLYFIGREVWVAHVITNFTNVLAHGNVLQFILAAFLNTRSVVQLLTIATLVGVLWLFRELARSVPTLRLA